MSGRGTSGPPSRPRRALEHQGGPTQTRGEPAVALVLAAALQSVRGAERDPLTHGLHAYPARMHHAIAGQVLEAWASERTRVLDPFCGSGTVLVEARRRGLRASGVDLNPLGLRIAEVACAWRDPGQRRHFGELVEHVTEASFERVSRRVKVRAPLSAEQRRWYYPHVLLELAGLHAEIKALPDGFDRRALEVVFSSIVVKFSKQRSETTAAEADKRIGKKVVTGFFGRKAQELMRRWAALAEVAPREGPAVRLFEGDARELLRVVGSWRFDLVLSSPPYGGTYDYAEHHALRYPWLGISDRALRQGELGSRRRLSEGRGAARQWDAEVLGVLRSIAAVMSARGRVVLLVGDAEVGGHRIAADDQLADLAGRAGMVAVASASQPRPDWRGGPGRREHLVALELDGPGDSR